MEWATPQLAAWENFYVIIGSAAAALIGIQFVVITLIADTPLRPSPDSIHAFGTPTVVHLTGALLVSVILSVPWTSLQPASVPLALCGFGGLIYGPVVFRRALRQDVYTPVWDDWFWYAIGPSGVYAVLALSALLLRARTPLALFGIGASALGLLLIGIRNSWDSVTHIVINHSHNSSSKKK